MPRFAFFGGKVVPIGEAKVSIMTHALNYGTGVFEGIRGYWNSEKREVFVFKLSEHYDRFQKSCRILKIEVPYTTKDLCDLTIDLLRREGYKEDCYVRPLAYKASEGIGVKLHGLKDGFAVFAVPFGKYIDKEEGARAAVSSWRRVDDNAAPARAKITGIYVNSALSKTEAVERGFDEAIVLTDAGHVSEGSAENIFLVRDGKLITPAATENILEGITRTTVMEIAKAKLRTDTIERQIDRSELYIADEVFFCGTGCQIAPGGASRNTEAGARLSTGRPDGQPGPSPVPGRSGGGKHLGAYARACPPSNSNLIIRSSVYSLVSSDTILTSVAPSSSARRA
jgi:branched-chain amino acid aminotransferase